VIERTDFDDAGVVDQNVNPAEMIDYFPDCSLNLIAIEEIAFHSKNSSAARSEIGFRAREFFWIPCQQSNLSAFVANVSRQHEAESTRSAADQGNFIAHLVSRRANDASRYPTADQKSACSEPNTTIHSHNLIIRYERFRGNGRGRGATARKSPFLGALGVFTIETRNLTRRLAIHSALLQISTLVTCILAHTDADFGFHLAVFPIQL